MHMRKFEIIDSGDGRSVRVTASTKAGFAIAALNGLFAVAAPRVDEEEAGLVRQPFDVQADGFGHLLAALLEKAAALAAAGNEMYEDIRFSLVTDTKAVGELVGKPVHGFRSAVRKAGEIKVEKNEEGMWESVIAFRP